MNAGLLLVLLAGLIALVAGYRYLTRTDGQQAPPAADKAHAGETTATALTGDYTVASGDTASEVREMFKILNLREADAGRLQISVEEYRGLKAGDSAMAPAQLTAVANRLKQMIL